MSALAWLVVGLPLLAAAVGMLPPRLLGVRGEHSVRLVTAVTAVTGTVLALVALVPLWLTTVLDPTRVRESGTRLTPTGGVEVFLGVRVDGLSASVAVLVCVVAAAVQVYSIAYLRDDPAAGMSDEGEGRPAYRSYAAFVSLFTGAMLLVVFAGDLVVLLVGWEVMGICSYVLIGHHWRQADNSSAGVKAFLVTKLGDVPFLFGIFALGTAAGSFRVTDVLAAVPDMPQATVVAGTVLLLAGVVGKSAQFPLHTWLPDAMAGPTPVSALIHAATMVAAGAYLVARLYPVFLQSPPALAVLGVVASVTMLGAACAALAQDDLKRVLAYSTVSQVAYMQAGLATGGYTAGVVHLLTHGAFKALLFLCAGVVIARVGTNLMSEMGGIRMTMPITFITMTIGFAALVGIPPLSGFFSKDAVLERAWEQAGATAPVVPEPVALIVLASGLLTVLVTAAYATRALLLTFYGRPGTARSVRDAEPGMAWPLLVLSVPSLVLGFAGILRRWLPSWVSSEGTGDPHAVVPGAITAVMAFVLVVVGVAVVYFVWVADPARDPVRIIGPLRGVFARGFGVDALYRLIVTRPIGSAARGVVRVDTEGIDATLVDSGRLAQRIGALARRTQTGNAQLYVTCVLVGAVVLAVGAVVLT
ncbi:MAG: NADH-quinone oxidoreductase subunit L [Streptosporangiales bacterium]|nr:NADH-quinone oxidoreductase subunit L [Streptosporangiales bacterium]